MVFTVNNKREAREFERVLLNKGWEYKYSVYWSRVYEKDGQTVFLHKSMNYKDKTA